VKNVVFFYLANNNIQPNHTHTHARKHLQYNNMTCSLIVMVIFLESIEMQSKFDPVTIEYVKRIQNNEINVHYLEHETQKEIIVLMTT